MAYERIEPFGTPAADVMNAMLCHLIATGLLKSDRPFEFEQFMLIKEQVEKPKKMMGWQAIKNTLTATVPSNKFKRK